MSSAFSCDPRKLELFFGRNETVHGAPGPAHRRRFRRNSPSLVAAAPAALLGRPHCARSPMHRLEMSDPRELSGHVTASLSTSSLPTIDVRTIASGARHHGPFGPDASQAGLRDMEPPPLFSNGVSRYSLLDGDPVYLTGSSSLALTMPAAVGGARARRAKGTHAAARRKQQQQARAAAQFSRPWLPTTACRAKQRRCAFGMASRSTAPTRTTSHPPRSSSRTHGRRSGN